MNFTINVGRSCISSTQTVPDINTWGIVPKLF